jgi:hypothetical protein
LDMRSARSAALKAVADGLISNDGIDVDMGNFRESV